MTKKLIFPTEEWVEKFWELLNANHAYKEAASTWEGDFFFEVVADGDAIKEDVQLYMDLWHGDCRLARMAEPGDNPEFIYSGTLANWKRLIAGEIDPIKGLMSRKFKLPTGDMGKIMRATKAAAELVATAQKVPTKYIDE
ncbi:MAG: SCP2 sterol-binding domain-containing protein [Candidatus Thorarchaeota archaeon]|nr:SCP2 sterol-binding domain-containing protein [Candidatus Thorarchaeota archaeon]